MGIPDIRLNHLQVIQFGLYNKKLCFSFFKSCVVWLKMIQMCGKCNGDSRYSFESSSSQTVWSQHKKVVYFLFQKLCSLVKNDTDVWEMQWEIQICF
jgi:hypothetical protein